jgi:hypothetical protein
MVSITELSLLPVLVATFIVVVGGHVGHGVVQSVWSFGGGSFVATLLSSVRCYLVTWLVERHLVALADFSVLCVRLLELSSSSSRWVWSFHRLHRCPVPSSLGAIPRSVPMRAPIISQCQSRCRSSIVVSRHVRAARPPSRSSIHPSPSRPPLVCPCCHD